MLGTSPRSAFDMEVLVYPQICNYCLQMKNISHCHFHLISPLIVRNIIEGNKCDRNSEEPWMLAVRNSPSGLQCYCGGESDGKAWLHNVTSEVGIAGICMITVLCASMHPMVFFINRKRNPAEQTHMCTLGIVNLRTLFLSLFCNTKAHLLVFRNIWFFKDLVDCSS